MIYTCNICNYKANHKNVYKKHCESKKHKEKEDELNDKSFLITKMIKVIPKMIQNTNDIKTTDLTCEYCKKEFGFATNYTRHKKTCKVKIEYERKKEFDMKLQMELDKKEIEMLKQTIGEMRGDKQFSNKMLECNTINMNGMIKTNISALNFLNTNYKDAPCLESFDQEFTDPFVFYLDKKDKDVTYNGESFIYKKEEKKKDEYLADKILDLQKEDIIVNYYCNKIEDHYRHHDNPEKQSCWASDSARNNFTICEEKADKTKGWFPDKKGIIFTKKIIKPLLDFTVNIVQSKIDIITKKIKKMTNLTKMTDLIKQANILADFIKSVDEHKIQPEIINKLSPIFFLDTSKQEELMKQKLNL
jgi:hypothetical protein